MTQEESQPVHENEIEMN